MERRWRGVIAGAAMVTALFAAVQRADCGEFRVNGTITIPGYKRVRSEYTVKVVDKGLVEITTRSAYTITIVGGPNDGQVTTVPAQRTERKSPPGVGKPTKTLYPAAVIETVPPRTEPRTVTVTYDSDLELSDLSDGSELANVELPCDPPGELLDQPSVLTRDAVGLVEGVTSESADTDGAAADATDDRDQERNAQIVGDPVSVATGELTVRESDLALNVGSIRLDLARVHRTSMRMTGSLGPGWFFSGDSRIVLGESTGARTAAAAATAAINALADPQTGAPADLAQMASDAIGARTAVRTVARNQAGAARSLESALLAIEYEGILRDEVHAEIRRRAGEAARMARSNEAVIAEMTDEIDLFRREIYPDAVSALNATVEELREREDDLLLLAERTDDHRRRNARYASVTPTPETVACGATSLAVIGPNGYPRRYTCEATASADSETTYPDGSRNFYPSGTTLSPESPSPDRLRLLADGRFVLEKKDGTTWTYGFHGELRRIEDRNANYFAFGYDADERLARITDSRGREFLLRRRADGRLAAIEGPEGFHLSYRYDEDGLLRSVTDEVGDETGYRYDGPATAPRLLTIVRPDASTRTYEYELIRGRWRAVAARDEAGARETFDFTDADRTVHENPNGLRRVHHLDARNRTTRIDHPGGLSEEFEYDADGNRTLHRSTDGTVIRYAYDARSNLIETRYPDGTTERRTYTDLDLPATSTDRFGLTTRYDYDDRGNLIRVEHPDGTTDTFVHVPSAEPAAGAVARHTDRRGNEVAYSYDERGFLAARTDSIGAVASFVRDAYGRPTSTADGTGARREYEYRADGRVRRVTGPNEYEVVSEYDERKDLVRLTEHGRTTTFEYDDRHLLLTVRNAVDEIVRYEYRDDGLMTAKTILGPAGAGGSDPDGRHVSRTEYRYNERGLLEAEHQVQIHATTEYEYDAAGRPAAVVEPTGARTEYVYDPDGRLESVTRFLGGRPITERYSYAPDGRLAQRTDALGSTWRWDHDRRMRTATERPPGRTVGTTTEYDPYGLPIRERDPAGGVREYRYDERGRLVEVRNADHRELSLAYDLADRVVARTDGEGAVTDYEYDGRGRLTTTTHPDGAERRFRYNADDTVREEIDETGLSTRYEYDPAGRLIARLDPSLPGGERRTTFVPHFLGGISQSTDPTGRTTRVRIDAAGRTVGTVDAAGELTAYELDAAGRLLLETDPTGRTVGYEYDALGRLVSVSKADVTTTEYSYDDVGRLRAETNGLGHAHEYVYDAEGRLEREVNRGGAEKRYDYDEAGRLLEIADYTGITARHAYDAAGRLVRVDYSDGSFRAYDYDRASRLVAADNPSERLTFRYDERGNLVETRGSATGTDLSYRYDSAGRRVARSDNAARTENEHVYDARGLLVGIDDSAAGFTSFEYDEAGRHVRTEAPNGVSTAVAYDLAGRTSATVVADRTGRVLSGEAHVYDAAGRRLYTVDETGAVTGYRYDELGRVATVQYPFSGPKRYHDYERFAELGIVRAVPEDVELGAGFLPGPTDSAGGGTTFCDRLHLSEHSDAPLTDALRRIHPLQKTTSGFYQQVWTEEFEYDAAGNRTSWATGWGRVRYTFDGQGRLADSGNQVYDYNVAGNLAREEGGSRSIEYEYDAEHRVATATTQAETVRYEYDALGRRIARLEIPTAPAAPRAPASGQQTARRSVMRYDGASGMVVSRDEIELEPGAHDHLVRPHRDGIGRYRPAPGSTGMQRGASRVSTYSHVTAARRTLSVSGPDGTRFLTHDLQGSVRTATDRTASHPLVYSYDAYGSSLRASPTTEQPYGYNGKPLDPTTRRYDYGYRDYAPTLGRFSTPDPAKHGGNWYAYVDADPVNLVDPWGLMPASDDEAAADGAPPSPYAHMVAGKAYAPAAGTVHLYPMASDNNPNAANEAYGNTAIIVHDNGYISALAHLDSFTVEDGARVNQGDEVGVIGASTTNQDLIDMPMLAHLHWSVKRDVTQPTSKAYYSDSYFWENESTNSLETRIETYKAVYDDNAAVEGLRNFVDPQTLVDSGVMIHPSNSEITSDYGPRDIVNFEYHYGIDYSAQGVVR
ncbi:MAG: RHS repeat-associated core domain-containing protein [Spirochaetota bacterium]